MIRPPPTSTLFPYTTLFRSASSPPRPTAARRRRRASRTCCRPSIRSRSEEHTSELQSPDQLVCRLLLEKKKNDAGCPVAQPLKQPITRHVVGSECDVPATEA